MIRVPHFLLCIVNILGLLQTLLQITLLFLCDITFIPVSLKYSTVSKHIYFHSWNSPVFAYCRFNPCHAE